MKKAVKLIVVIVIAITLFGRSHATDDQEPTLQSAKIIFSIPEGDDKDDNTKVTITVSTKAGQFDKRIAYLEDFGDQQVWEDDGNHSYPYDMSVAPGITMKSVTNGGIKTRIDWKPVGNDRGFFNYRLILRFSDGSELEQTNPSLIEMSEKLRTYTNP
jgi:hypothetical protein